MEAAPIDPLTSGSGAREGTGATPAPPGSRSPSAAALQAKQKDGAARSRRGCAPCRAPRRSCGAPRTRRLLDGVPSESALRVRGGRASPVAFCAGTARPAHADGMSVRVQGRPSRATAKASGRPGRGTRPPAARQRPTAEDRAASATSPSWTQRATVATMSTYFNVCVLVCVISKKTTVFAREQAVFSFEKNCSKELR